MAVRDAHLPAVLWRVGRYPDPFAWTPRQYAGSGRFDDPAGEFRALYAAGQRLACFLETLALFRPDLAWLAEVRRLPVDPGRRRDLTDAGRVPPSWHTMRRVARLGLHLDLHALDLRAVETREALRTELAPLLDRLGFADFDLGDALNRDRRLTQHIAGWAYQQGYRAIAYPSRFAAELHCWVLFGGEKDTLLPPFTPLSSDPIERNDPDLIEAARLFGLRL